MQIEKLTLDDVATKKRRYLETIFSLGDGHFGVRDAIPFTGAQTGNLPIMLVNGFYAVNPIVYGERAYGYAKNHQTIISLTSPRLLDFKIDNADSRRVDEWNADLITTDLDFSTGILMEKFRVRTVSKKHFELIVQSQMVLDGSHRYIIRYTLQSLDYTGKLELKRPLHQRIGSSQANEDPRVAERDAPLDIDAQAVEAQYIQWATVTANQVVIQRDTVIDYPRDFDLSSNKDGFDWHGMLTAGDELTWSFCRQVSDINEPLSMTHLQDYQTLNKRVLARFWHHSAVEISAKKLQKGIQYNLFQLFQSAGRNGLTNIAAKGITGPGYEGHYFWDTEMYILPFFIYTNPSIAKQLLKYRFSILGQARERARELGVDKGALFAWRTINGQEASAYYPAGTAQYHIDADIAHAIKLYADVTEDTEFLREYGAKIVLETARFWLSYGSWHERNGRQQFCLFKVTGPDEYTALVDNNYYTNRMAKENLDFAAWLIHHQYVEATLEEANAFSTASEGMYLPYDQHKGITRQDDDSPRMPIWPFEATSKQSYPLLLHYHPLTIYRYQVNKQADTLLAEMLFPEDQSNAQLKRDYQYYEPITTHDSSLSRSIFSILASRLDQRAEAFNYYMDTALMDLVDLQGNAEDGLHEANLGGSWLGLTCGFSGMYVTGTQLHLANHLPAQIKQLRFRICFRKRVLEVQMRRNKMQVRLIDGAPLNITINGKRQQLEGE